MPGAKPWAESESIGRYGLWLGFDQDALKVKRHTMSTCLRKKRHHLWTIVFYLLSSVWVVLDVQTMTALWILVSTGWLACAGNYLPPAVSQVFRRRCSWYLYNAMPYTKQWPW